MTWWYYAVMFVVSLVVSYATRPKPQNARPSGLGDVQAPTAEVGRELSVLFGTRPIYGANVVWYGDFMTQAIKSKGGKK